MDSKVSIVVPMYKVEKYLPQCLDSIISQTYTNLEIILVDDGSPDRCGEICDQYAERDSRISVIHKSNGGLVSAWKAGLAKASGEYIACIDSDDYVDSDYIERLVAGLVSEDIDMVCSQSYQDNEQKITKLQINELSGVHNIDDGILESLIVNKDNTGIMLISNNRWSKLIRTSIARDAAVQCSEKIVRCEDQQFMVHCVVRARKVNGLDYYGYYYRTNPTSIIHSYLPGLWESSEILVQVLSKAGEVRHIANWRKQLNNRVIASAWTSIDQELVYRPDGYKKRAKAILKDKRLRDAFKDYYIEGMQRYERWMVCAIKTGMLTSVRMVKWLLKVYLWLKR